MDTTFKFGDKVALKRSPNACGIVARVYIDKVTVLWKDEYCGMSTDPIEEFIPYIDTNTSNIEKVMDALGIKKDVPIDVYTKTNDMGYPHNPYVFNGKAFIDDIGYSSLDVLSDIFLKGAYFKTHLSSGSFPPKGHIYWYVNPEGEVKYVIWNETTWDYALKLMGNVFKTEVEAKCHVTEMLAKYREVM